MLARVHQNAQPSSATASMTKEPTNSDKHQKRCLEVPEILAIVFFFLAEYDLQIARLVNRLWNLCADEARTSRSRNILQLVLVCVEGTTNGLNESVTVFGNHRQKYASLNPQVLVKALELAALRAGLDPNTENFARNIGNLIASHSIIDSLSKSTTSTITLVPVTLHCTDHVLSADLGTLVKKFAPIQKSKQQPHYISESALNDWIIQAIVGVNFKRGSSAGIKYVAKCITGSPSGATGKFSRDTRSVLFDNGGQTMNYKVASICNLIPMSDKVIRDGYLGSLREGCFGSDFVAGFDVKALDGTPPPTATVNSLTGGGHMTDLLEALESAESSGSSYSLTWKNINVQEYETYRISESGNLLKLPLTPSRVKRQCFRLDTFWVNDNWLASSNDPSAHSSTFLPLGEIYCRKKWSLLNERCKGRGLCIDETGYTDKALFYLRKYLFTNDLNHVKSLIQALKLMMYVWADKLSYFFDHDFKIRIKQAEIIERMHFDSYTMQTHLKKLKDSAVHRYLENPIGVKYLHVTGYKSQMDNLNAIFQHLSKTDVQATRSKAFHEKITQCVNIDSFEI